MKAGFAQAEFDSDGNHFIYCAEGSTVQIDVLAKFTNGLDCDDCSHDPRAYTWTVSGATSHTITGQTDGPSKSFITVELSEADDTISIECAVSAVDTEGECAEDRHGNVGDHGGSHAGATASCTIKLWRVDLEATGGDAELDAAQSYKTRMAASVTTRGVIVGATPVEVELWEWESWVEEDLINTMAGSDSWTGTIVAATNLVARVRVENGCDATQIESESEDVWVKPEKRRPGWEMDATFGMIEDSWHQDNPNLFPSTAPQFKAWAQNTNSNAKYKEHNQVLVTPIYIVLENYPNDYSEFINKIDMVTSGPNLEFWYNSDPAIFECARMARINHWITPGATRPATAPANSPYGGTYSNWLQMYPGATIMFDSCTCADPVSHDGLGNNIGYRSNIWHEGYGCPSSPNSFKIGHQIRIENAVNLGKKDLYDAVWKCDLISARSDTQLRLLDESARISSSNELKKETLEVHKFLNDDPYKHNFTGVVHRADGSSWVADDQLQ